MNGESLNIQQDNLDKLKEIFPDVLSEGKLDWEKLKATFSDDINLESDFAKDCESSENIEFYFKLPFWFKIDTPIGNYNPDWAIVFKGENKIYFVAETKSSGQELRGSEKMKIDCGKAHFREFKEVEFKQVTKVSDLI